MARGPGRMDWSNQPDPFRSYEGSKRLALDRLGFEGMTGKLRPSPLTSENLSRFFFESLALSGRKAVAGAEWTLRVNPSSGNLHPTECYLLAGGGEELDLSPGVYHYQPKDHSLELLAGIREESWQSLHLPPGTILLILTTIYWRESWKYGARAFRYCMLDLGHALAAAGEAACCLGWTLSLQEELGTDDLARILWNEPDKMTDGPTGKERPDVMLALFSDGRVHRMNERAKEDLRGAMDPDFFWERPSRTPPDLELYQLAQGDARPAAKESSCRQDIASDGCFAAAMISRFEGPIEQYGPWFYPRLYWECGMIGQALYLSSEATGFQGCGIGCFFDDMVHRMLGLPDLGYQDLYHFTVGRALADTRLIDLPAYG